VAVATVLKSTLTTEEGAQTIDNGWHVSQARIADLEATVHKLSRSVQSLNDDNTLLREQSAADRKALATKEEFVRYLRETMHRDCSVLHNMMHAKDDAGVERYCSALNVALAGVQENKMVDAETGMLVPSSVAL